MIKTASAVKANGLESPCAPRQEFVNVRRLAEVTERCPWAKSNVVAKGPGYMAFESPEDADAYLAAKYSK